MTTSTYDQEVRKLCSNIAELCILKHRSYGTGNLLNSPFKPRTVIAVRLYEKVARMANLIETGHEPEEETYMDTLKDIIGYTVAAIQIEEGTFSLPMDEQRLPTVVDTDGTSRILHIKAPGNVHGPGYIDRSDEADHKQ